MDTLQLKLFLSLSKTLNFTKTANEFYVTQPTVSNYIKSLEGSIGVKLLNRDSRSVSLTPEGVEFIVYANQMLSLQAEAENRLRNMAEGRRGYLRVAILSSATDLFTDCLTEFSNKYRTIQINVCMLEGFDMMTAISQRSYDIYFAHAHQVADSENTNVMHTFSSQLSLYAHRSIADSIDINDWNTLKQYHFISAPDDEFTLSNHIKRICANRGITPDVINYFNRADTILLGVNSGVGVAILPRDFATFYNYSNVVCIPIPGNDVEISNVVAWHKNNSNPDIPKFLELSALKKYENQH
ncbi:MAG: LysR family transcriptional regulator, partial [Oscillospiraceae bacterium]|nr:LysR family transcriptional regulator [Oscillospiraceae bacterium]